MADEAVLRIITQIGGGSQQGGPLPSAGPSSPSGSQPTSAGTTGSQPQQRTAPTQPPSGGGFDPVEVARKRIQREDELAQVEVEYAKLKPAPMLDLGFDPVMEAQKRLEADRRRAAVDAEYARLRPVQPLFNPQAEADKRRDGERRRAQVDTAYREKYGGDEQTTRLDSFLDIANKLRGTIGGLFGTMVGALLDLVTGLRKAEVAANRKKQEQDILNEAADVLPVGSPSQGPSAPSNTTKAGAPKSPTVPSLPKAQVPTGAVPAAVPAGTATSGAAAGAAGAGSGAAAGAAGAAMAAAGPAGVAIAAVVAVKVIGDAIAQLVKNIAGSVREVLTKIVSADTDPSKPIEDLGEAVVKVGDKIPVLGIAIAAILAGETLKTVAAVMQAIDKNAERYAKYSPQIAQAQAIAEIRQTMGDLRRAQEISSEMAKYIMARSDLQQKWEDIKARMLNKILPIVTRILEVIEVAMVAGESISDAVSLLAAPMKMISEILSTFLNMKVEERQGNIEDPTQQILNNENFDRGGAWVPGAIPSVGRGF